MSGPDPPTNRSEADGESADASPREPVGSPDGPGDSSAGGTTRGWGQISLQGILDEFSPLAETSGARSELPDRLGRYRILAEMGHGGFGVIYRARDQDLGREVALKILIESRKNPEACQRFLEEAQIGGQLQHPGIVPVHEMGLVSGDTPYFTMKLVKGRTLAALLRERKQLNDGRQRFLSIFEHVCQALAYAHSRGVIHRDLKPSNIMVGRFGETQVMDWGLAKVLSEGGIHDERRAKKTQAATQVSVIQTRRSESDSALSVSGSILGTPAYMAPEQAQGLVEELDQRSDVFGLGAVLCEILTGHPPYRGKTAKEIQRRAEAADLTDAMERLAACAADEEVVVLARKCLAPEARKRPRDAGSVAKVMRSYFDSMEEKTRAAELEAAEARVKTEGERKARWLEFAMAVIVVVALCLAGGFYLKRESDRRGLAVRATREVDAAIAAVVELRGRAGSAAVADPTAWGEVVAAADTALALAARDGVEPDTRRRAEDLAEESRRSRAEAVKAAGVLETDRAMVDRLAAIRMEHGPGFLEEDEAAWLLRVAGQERQADGTSERHSERERTRRSRRDEIRISAYEKAFAEYFEGFDSSAAAPRIRETSISLELVRALDDWALAWRRREDATPPEEGKEASGGWKAVLQIAREADPDPWRERIRDASAARDIDELRRIGKELPQRYYGQPGEPELAAGSVPSDEVLPAVTYDLLAQSLLDGGDSESAVEFYERAHVYHPADFWIHHGLATLLALSPPRVVRDVDSHAYLSAAVALRRFQPHTWSDLGAVLLRDGYMDEAISCFEEVVRLDPDHPEAPERLGDAHARSGDFEAAAKAYEDAVRRRQDDARVHWKLGRALERSGSLEQAVAAFRTAVRLAEEPALFLELGKALERQGNHPDAMRAFEIGTRLDAANADLQFSLGLSLVWARRHREALIPLEKALELRPDDARVHQILGIALGEGGRTNEAVAHLAAAVRLAPDLAPMELPGTRSRRPGPAEEKEDVDSAVRLLETALRENPADAALLAQHGVWLLRSGELEAAISRLREAIAADPTNALASRSLGLSLFRNRQVEEARATLEKLLELDPRDAAARNNLAVLSFEEGDTARALAGLRQAANLTSTRARIHANLGLVLISERRFEEAITAFQRAARMDPGDAEIRNWLAAAFLEQWKNEEASEAARRALALEPRHARALAHLGSALGRKGMGDKAVTLLEKSVDLEPFDARTYVQLGEVRLSRGETVEARRVLERARNFDPELWLASHRLARVHAAEGKHRDELEALRRVLESNPRHTESWGRIRELLEDDEIDLAASVDALVRTLETMLASAEEAPPESADLFLLAWCRRPQSLDREKPLAVARRRVEESRRQDLRALLQLARTERAAGLLKEAVLTAEEAASLPSATEEAVELLEEYRKSALPDLLTNESVDWALEKPEDLVPPGSGWRYFGGTRDPSPGLEWTRSDFDDGGWEEARSPFGYRRSWSGLGQRTTLPRMLGSYSTLYARRAFLVSDPERFRKVLVSVKADDGFIAWWNGTEVGRVRAGKKGERKAHDATADDVAPEPPEATLLEVDKQLIQQGENVVAVEGLNHSKDDQDFRLELAVLAEPKPEDDPARLRAFAAAARGDDARDRLTYLEGRILQRAGADQQAAAKFREILGAGASQAAPLLRLTETLRDPAELRRALGSFREELATRGVAPRLLARPPEVPVPLQPAADATVGDGAVSLEASPFFVFDRGLAHAKSRWQIRAAAADYAEDPAFDSSSAEDLTTLTLERGRLLPRTTYVWRVEYVDSRGRRTGFSAETSFTTGDLPFRPVSFDLSAHFNRDVVMDPGDGENDALEIDSGLRFTVAGFDGTGTRKPGVRGLPENRQLGIHRLGDYAGENALQFSPAVAAAVRVEVPRGRYACVRFLVAGVPGSSRVPLTLEYADGSREERAVHCEDLSYDLGEQPPKSYPGARLEERQGPVWNAMNLFRQGKLERHADGALFEVIVSVREDRELVSLLLEPKKDLFAQATTTFNLFAITGMAVEGR